MQTLLTMEEIGSRARAIFAERLAAKIDVKDRHKFLVIDIESGDYEIDTDEDIASDRIEMRHPQGVFYLLRADGGPAYFLGHTATVAIGQL